MEFKEPPRENYKAHSAHRPAAALHHETSAEKLTPHKKARIKVPHSIKRWWKIALAVVLIAAVAWLAYGYIHTKNELAKLSNPKTAGQTETQQLVAKVGKLVNLPSGESPTLATVNDAAKLKTQPFFADAKNGDKVLIYNNSSKAILYRPSTNKIIQYSNLKISGS